MKRIDRVVEYLRTSLWAIPAAGVCLAVVAGFGTVALDHATGTELGFTGGADGARSVLSTIAAAMITFTGLVFSITIVALQLASGQFSPRVMRTFLRDNTSKIALATFVATFSYALTVLRATRADDVPGISVNVAIVLIFASVAVFIHYIDHTAHAIRAAAIIDAVAVETRASIERVYPADAVPVTAVAQLVDAPIVVANGRGPGVVTGFDGGLIVERAARAGGVVVLRAGVGDFVPAGAPLLELHGTDPEACRVDGCVSLARERTMHQDVAFGVRQLVDLAAKALSPGINDPTTAVQAIDQLHDLLRRLARRPMPSGADDRRRRRRAARVHEHGLGGLRLAGDRRDPHLRREQPAGPATPAQHARGPPVDHRRTASGAASRTDAVAGGRRRAGVPGRAGPARGGPR